MAVARDFLWAAHPSMKSFQFRPEGFLRTAQCCTLNKESCLRIDGVKSMRLHACFWFSAVSLGFKNFCLTQGCGPIV